MGCQNVLLFFHLSYEKILGVLVDFCIPGNVLKIRRFITYFLRFHYITDVMSTFHQWEGVNIKEDTDVLDSILKNLSVICPLSYKGENIFVCSDFYSVLDTIFLLR